MVGGPCTIVADPATIFASITSIVAARLVPFLFDSFELHRLVICYLSSLCHCCGFLFLSPLIDTESTTENGVFVFIFSYNFGPLQFPGLQ